MRGSQNNKQTEIKLNHSRKDTRPDRECQVPWTEHF